MTWSDFGLNVGIEFIGLVVGVPITVYFVDRLIRKRYEKRLIGLKTLIKEDIVHLSITILTSVRAALGISVYEALKLSSREELYDILKDVKKAQVKLEQFGERFIEDFELNFRQKLLEMSPTAWKGMFEDFIIFHKSINNLFSMYAGYIEPKSAQHLICIRKKLFNIINVRRTLPEAFDASHEGIKHDETLLAARYGTATLVKELVIDVLGLMKNAGELQ